MKRPQRMRSRRWRGILLASCLFIAACKSPAPGPPSPGTPIPPPDAEQIAFSEALFSIYYQARLDTGRVQAQLPLVPLIPAAPIVDQGAARFGDIWRVLALTQLAASGINRPAYKAPINKLARNQGAQRRLRDVLSEHPHADLRQREELVYADVLGNLDFYKVSTSGMPKCDHALPTTTPTHKGSFATVDITASIVKPFDEVPRVMDPQNWDAECGDLFFNAAHLVDPPFIPDPNTFDLKPGKEETVGETWATRSLFEYFLVPSLGGGFFKNVLKVTPSRAKDNYSVTYLLEQPVRSEIPPDPKTTLGLIIDVGSVSAVDATAGVTMLKGQKTVQFAPKYYPSHTADQLGSTAATFLELMGDGFPYWVCCPK